MISEDKIKEHIKLLEAAVDFMKKNKDKGAKKLWIKNWQKYSEILKWVVGEPSEYEEIYKHIETLRQQYKNTVSDASFNLTGSGPGECFERSGMNINPDISDTDRLFADSPDAGDPECLCSRCGKVIEGGTVIRARSKIGEGEYRYHHACLSLMEA